MSRLDLMKDVIEKASETIKTYHRVDDEGAMINAELCEVLDELNKALKLLHNDLGGTKYPSEKIVGK
jgi:molybdopterin biosynthesis enzyme MoaB